MTEFIILLGVATTAFFIAKAINRLFPEHLRWIISDHDKGPTSFGAARDAAHERIPFAFT